MKDPLTILIGDALEVLKTLPDDSVQCCVTSPPYWGLRDYGVEGQIGLEPDFDTFLSRLVSVFDEVRRVLKPDGTCWVNMGDSYTGANHTSVGGNQNRVNQEKNSHSDNHINFEKSVPGCKPKDLIGQPWELAFALRRSGWYLRSDIIWNKPNPMPESVADRPTKSHEYLFLLTKSESYYYDKEAIQEIAICGHRGSSFVSDYDLKTKPNLGKKPRPSQSKGSFKGKTEAMADTGQNAFRAVTEYRNKRSVWTVASQPYSDAHFATFPPNLIKPCILAGTKQGDTVLDPFGGSGTSGQVALELGRKAILIELNPDYKPLIENRTTVTLGML